MKNLTAKSIMNRNVLTVREDMTVRELADFFTENMISGAPVVDENSKIIGVVSMTDIVQCAHRKASITMEEREATFYRGWEQELSGQEMENFHVEECEWATVHEIMTPLSYKVSEDTTVDEMAEIMINGRIHRLLVTRDDRLLGIVTTLDMLKVLKGYTSQ
jgi:CBS domain-containing protein